MNKIILILALLIFIIGCAKELENTEEVEEKITCEDYCEQQPHIMCVGNWEISGEYPNCECKFVCDVEEVGTAPETTEDAKEEPAEEDLEGEEYDGFFQSKNWRSEVADDDGWVGIDSSIAVDATGNPHISHYDAGNKNLKYAYLSGGSWKKEVIDSKGDVGEESGIAIDSKGNVHISYNDATNGALKYAKKTGSSWSIESVDKKSRAHVVTTSLALDAKGNPHIAYNMESPNGDFVKYASWDGNSWKIEEATSGGSDVYLALDSNYNPHIAFVKGGPRDKKIYYTSKISGKWKTELVDSSTTAGGDCGIGTDSNNYAHITYHNYGKGAIKYAKFGGTSWKIQTVVVNIGKQEGLRIAVDSEDNPHIVYVDNNKELLMYAVLDGISWTKEIVNRMGIPSITIDHLGRVHVAHGYTLYEEEGGDGDKEILKYSIKE